MSRWSKWRKAHPDTVVLYTDTGFGMEYTDKTPYGDYDASERVVAHRMFWFAWYSFHTGTRLHANVGTD